jgi:multiple sugar transport system permease protein
MLILSCFMFLFPIAWMLLTAMKSNQELMRIPLTILPERVDLSKLKALLFSDRYFFGYFVNSLVVAGVGTIISTANSVAAGFCFAKLQFRGKKFLFFAILATLMIPFESYMIPLFNFTASLGILNTYTGLIFPIIVSSFGVFLMTQYMQTIPDEMIEAAKIDGAGVCGVFFRIVIPNALSPIMLLIIFQFMNAWGDFIWPLIITKTQSMYVMELGITKYRNTINVDYGLLMSASFLAITPVIVVYLFFKRFITESIVMTGLKA